MFNKYYTSTTKKRKKQLSSKKFSAQKERYYSLKFTRFFSSKRVIKIGKKFGVFKLSRVWFFLNKIIKPNIGEIIK